MPQYAWRIYLLGDARLARADGREVTRFESRKVVTLLARVALRPDRLHAREELAALLWPDADRRVGLERLRHVLSSLQRQLAEATDDGAPAGADPLLLTDRAGVRLNAAAVWCDAVAFEGQVHARRFADARALYKGDLLPGHYDDWIQDERERLRALLEEAEEGETDAGPAPVPTPTPEPAPPTVFLPTYLTAFFGREAERAALRGLLRERRLVTLTGAGGCGKTRLAVETCRDAAEEFAAVVFVPLAECVEPERIPDRLRAALGLPAGPGTDGPPLEQVAAALAGRPALLLLDNLEQMSAAGAAEAVEALLSRLPYARCLVTSRTLLHVPGEQAFPLAPLPVPEEGGALPPSLLLFVDRARAARPDFAVTEHNRDDLHAVCRLLDGIPLALELAASRVRAHTPAEMRRQIAEEGRRFALVARPDAAARKDPRHGSLHAALAWSWRLLPPRQQEFLAALSVLRGRWTAADAAAVCGEPDARTLLEELNAASLVVAEGGDGREGVTRFRLLETVRAFAAEQLPAERCAALRRANAAHALAVARGAESAARLGAGDLPPLEGALEDAVADGDVPTALALCAALDELWLRFGRADVALPLVESAAALPGLVPAALRAEALEVASYLATAAMDLEHAARLADRAEEAAEEGAEDIAARASARLARGRVMLVRRDPPGPTRAVLDEAAHLSRRAGLPRAEASAENLLGLLAGRERDFDAAEAHLARTQRLWEGAGRPERANHVRYNRAAVVSDRGDIERALALYGECLTAARAGGDRNLEAQIFNNLGVCHARAGRWAESLAAFAESIRRGHALGYTYSLAFALWNVAEPLAYTGRGAAGAAVLAFASRFWTDGGSALTDDDRGFCDRVYAEAARSLPNGPAELPARIAEGEALTLAGAVSLALSAADAAP